MSLQLKSSKNFYCMCGIYGYVGKRQDAASIVLSGLKELEYRGYDSWGVAWSAGNVLSIKKKVGKIGNATLGQKAVSSLAIGHTRWATHGGVTQHNAHPHHDCGHSIAVVHNGIVENHKILKDTLIQLGHKFESQTDTEVIVHLIEHYMKKLTFREAVNKTVKEIQGMNAILVLNKKLGEIAAFRNGSPLVVGIGKNEYFIASDVQGIGQYTKKVVFLEENQLVFLSYDKFGAYKGQLPAAKNLTDNFVTIGKGKFDHYMLKEISEQPSIVRNLISRENEIFSFAQKLKNKKLLFVGCGTAYYASLMAHYFFAELAKKQTTAAIGSEAGLFEQLVDSSFGVVFFSQSGETIDLIENAQKFKERGTKIYSIVNKPYSSLERLSAATFHLGAGSEICVLSTKSYVAKLVTALICANYFAKRRSVLKDLKIAADTMESAIKGFDRNKSMTKAAKYLTKKDHVFVIGRGSNYPLALETALKIKEGTYIHAESFAGGDLKHGPIALIEKGMPCICIANTDQTYEDTISNATEIKARGGYIIGVSPKDNPVFDLHIKIDEAGIAWPIVAVTAMQLLSYKMMLLLGRDPDKPRNLAKSVTVK